MSAKTSVVSKEHKELAERAKTRVTKAIKDRTTSFTSLREAAASSFLLGVKFGRWDVFNNLFTSLANHPNGRIDADALRTKFVARVVESFGAGGVPYLDENGEQKGWIKRPISFVSYREKIPADQQPGSHFFQPVIKPDNEENKEKIRLVQEGKQNVIDAGEEMLETIEWQSRQAVVRGDSTYDESNFRQDIFKVLERALKMLKSDSSLQIPISTIKSIYRDAGLEKKETAKLEAMILDLTPPAKKETAAESYELIKTPASEEKEAA